MTTPPHDRTQYFSSAVSALIILYRDRFESDLALKAEIIAGGREHVQEKHVNAAWAAVRGRDRRNQIRKFAGVIGGVFLGVFVQDFVNNFSDGIPSLSVVVGFIGFVLTLWDLFER